MMNIRYLNLTQTIRKRICNMVNHYVSMNQQQIDTTDSVLSQIIK